jgi:hypothetical protein
MAAIHLASCDLVAFLRTFNRLQRSLFFIKSFHFSDHEDLLGSWARPSNACAALHSLSGECFHLICPESSIEVPYPLSVKGGNRAVRHSAAYAGKPDSWQWQLLQRRLVSVRRRGNLSATFMAMMESATQSLYHRIFLAFSC